MIRFLRSLISNLAALILAFILAVIIWVNASQAEDPIRSQFLQIPVELIGQPENSILQSPSRQQTVQIVYEGRSSIVNRLSDQDFVATADLSQANFGVDQSVPIQITAKNAGVTILTQSPEELMINLEQLVSRQIAVRLDVRGTVARGHSQGTPLTEPATITVSGPASRVEPLEFARATVFLNSERETKIEMPQPIFYDRQGRVASVTGLSLDAEQVKVTIPIDEAEDFAEKFVTVDWSGEPAPGYRLLSVSADPASVLIQGSPTKLGQLTRLQTEPIDITGLTATFQQQVSLMLPDGLTLDQDQQVFVKIEIEPIFTTATYNRLVTLQGLGEGLEATAVPEEVRIFLFGPLPVLDALLEDEVNVTVDLFGLDIGTYALEPDLNIPDRGMEVRSIQPSQITVSITRPLTITAAITQATLLELPATLAHLSTPPPSPNSPNLPANLPPFALQPYRRTIIIAF